jgi:hypothetical protein
MRRDPSKVVPLKQGAGFAYVRESCRPAWSASTAPGATTRSHTSRTCAPRRVQVSSHPYTSPLGKTDEAHGTAGDLGRPWAAIHDNARIPADFRLYLTATPRILASPRPQRGKDGQELEIAAMGQDSETYGPWLAELGLSEAIEREILAGFEIDVLEIRDPSPVLGESEEARRGRRLALLQTALLEHSAAYNLRTVMTFHQKVEEAAAFAEALPKTAAQLYVKDASDDDLAAADRLPKSSIDAEFYELEASRHVPPDRVWSAWLCGDHLVSERREVLRQFAGGIDAAGRRVHRAFLASCRVLGEGVDITGERGVEAVCFADTRGSQVESRAEHRPGPAAEPRRQHEGRTDHRADLPGARRGPDRHGRQRLVPPPCSGTSRAPQS